MNYSKGWYGDEVTATPLKLAGNIIGCICRYEAIPQFFKDDLELHDAILYVADDL